MPRHWKRLKNWIEPDRNFLLWRQRLDLKGMDWKRLGYDVLLRGNSLYEAKHFLKERGEDLSAYTKNQLGSEVTSQ